MMMPGSAAERVFLRLGKALPRMMPTMIGSTAPRRLQTKGRLSGGSEGDHGVRRPDDQRGDGHGTTLDLGAIVAHETGVERVVGSRAGGEDDHGGEAQQVVTQRERLGEEGVDDAGAEQGDEDVGPGNLAELLEEASPLLEYGGCFWHEAMPFCMRETEVVGQPRMPGTPCVSLGRRLLGEPVRGWDPEPSGSGSHREIRDGT